jgi:hypothetical protein
MPKGAAMPKSIPQVSFSTTLSKPTKDLLDRFCRNRGLRINHIVERAILELLEDEMDREIIEQRELEPTVEWKKRA